MCIGRECENEMGYQVVRQDYFNCQSEPQFTFGKGRAYINSFGLKHFPDKEYIQILVNKEKKSLIIRPMAEKIKDSVRWSAGSKKRRPRHMSCTPLYLMIYQMMGWDLSARYRITGTFQKDNMDELIFFDLMQAICFESTDAKNAEGRAVIKKSFPKSWEYNYGIAKKEYSSEMITKYDDDSMYAFEIPVNSGLRDKMRNLDFEPDDKEKE